MALTENEKKVIEALRKIAKRGNDAEIRIEYCDEIPVLASGKRRYIVNDMFK